MATITISLSGSSITGLTGNPSKTYTISDADLQSLLTWAGSRFNTSGQSNAAILQSWIQGWIVETIHAVQVAAETTPPAINIS